MEEGAIKSAVEFLTREYERGVGAFAQIPLQGYYRGKPYTVTTSSCKSPRLTLFLFCATWSTYHGFFPTEHEPPSCARVGSNGAAGRSGIGGSRVDPSRAEWSRVEPSGAEWSRVEPSRAEKNRPRHALPSRSLLRF